MKSFKITIHATTELDVSSNDISDDIAAIIEDDYGYLNLKSINTEETENDHDNTE